MPSTVRFNCFPRTSPPPPFVRQVVGVFEKNEAGCGSKLLAKGLTSDEVLQLLRSDLEGLGFQVESGKGRDQKIHRPVFFGEGGIPQVRYEIDAYHPDWRCGLEVEAGRAWMGNAVYRDLILAGLMVDVDHLILAVPNEYKYKTGGRDMSNRDFELTASLADTLYAHRRLVLPYGLTVVGY